LDGEDRVVMDVPLPSYNTFDVYPTTQLKRSAMKRGSLPLLMRSFGGGEVYGDHSESLSIDVIVILVAFLGGSP